MMLQGIGRNDRDAVYPPVFAIADGFCCGLSGIEAEELFARLAQANFLDAASRRPAAKRSRRQDCGYTAPRTAASRRRDEAMVLVL